MPPIPASQIISLLLGGITQNVKGVVDLSGSKRATANEKSIDATRPARSALRRPPSPRATPFGRGLDAICELLDLSQRCEFGSM